MKVFRFDSSGNIIIWRGLKSYEVRIDFIGKRILMIIPVKGLNDLSR